MPDHDAHDIIVLFSARSRDAYAAKAIARGETYTFTDAWGLPRTWVKGEHAYLAPNAAGLLLARCNLKHHLVEEAALDAARAAVDAATQRLTPTATDVTAAQLEVAKALADLDAWLDGQHYLVARGVPPTRAEDLGLERGLSASGDRRS